MHISISASSFWTVQLCQSCHLPFTQPAGSHASPTVMQARMFDQLLAARSSRVRKLSVLASIRSSQLLSKSGSHLCLKTLVLPEHSNPVLLCAPPSPTCRHAWLPSMWPSLQKPRGHSATAGEATALPGMLPRGSQRPSKLQGMLRRTCRPVPSPSHTPPSTGK